MSKINFLDNSLPIIKLDAGINTYRILYVGGNADVITV
jgi:hypothetical protein